MDFLSFFILNPSPELKNLVFFNELHKHLKLTLAIFHNNGLKPPIQIQIGEKIMEIGILGLQQSGKSTLFQIMTGVSTTSAYSEPFIKGIAKVPDERFDRLVEIFKPAKVSPAAIPFIDVNTSGEGTWEKIRQALNTVDGVLHIVDGFSTTSIDEMVKRYKKLSDELIFSDLIIVENRLERLAKLPQKSLKSDELNQARIFPKIKELLESGKPVRELKLTEDEYTSIKGFTFWTIRPELIVINTSEGTANITESFSSKAGISSPVISICCKVESEIASLPPKDQREFLNAMGIETPAFKKIIQTAFSLMGQICYFTVGEDEVKAWVIPANSTAPKASAAIHKDFERGFIKAEVVSYDDFMACGGTIAAAKSSGKFRLEGKEYIVQDGDIISFRFNV